MLLRITALSPCFTIQGERFTISPMLLLKSGFGISWLLYECVLISLYSNLNRASPSEFVIPLAKYYKAACSNQISLGMRFRMMFETEESGTRR